MEEKKLVIEGLIDFIKDSYEWDTPSKGGAKKVYFDILGNPKDAGVKVERIKYLQKLAVGEINIDEYNEIVEKIK